MVNDSELVAYKCGWKAYEDHNDGYDNNVMNPYKFDTEWPLFKSFVRGWKECEAFFEVIDSTED